MVDPERRNRVAALLATTDHIPAALGRELLAAHDDAINEAGKWVGESSRAMALAIKAQARADEMEADARRLVAWIIKNPRPGPEMTEVLELHDRTLPF